MFGEVVRARQKLLHIDGEDLDVTRQNMAMRLAYVPTSESGFGRSGISASAEATTKARYDSNALDGWTAGSQGRWLPRYVVALKPRLRGNTVDVEITVLTQMRTQSTVLMRHIDAARCADEHRVETIDDDTIFSEVCRRDKLPERADSRI